MVRIDATSFSGVASRTRTGTHVLARQTGAGADRVAEGELLGHVGIGEREAGKDLHHQPIPGQDAFVDQRAIMRW
jgi:hypothetical protein